MSVPFIHPAMLERIVPTTDVRIRDEGSLVLFNPVSEAAKAWWDEGVEYEEYQRTGDFIAVEHRMANAIYIGLVEAGFNINVE